MYWEGFGTMVVSFQFRKDKIMKKKILYILIMLVLSTSAFAGYNPSADGYTTTGTTGNVPHMVSNTLTTPAGGDAIAAYFINLPVVTTVSSSNVMSILVSGTLQDITAANFGLGITPLLGGTNFNLVTSNVQSVTPSFNTIGPSSSLTIPIGAKGWAIAVLAGIPQSVEYQ